MIPRSFDVIGSVAIVEIPEQLRKQEQQIAKEIMRQQPSVRTVCAKAGARQGQLRLRKLRVIAGSGTETEHVEHGCRYRLDVAKAYFSPREATERLRIARLVQPHEHVLVPFAGCGPFAILIAKQQPAALVTGIEVNAAAWNYFEGNAFRNHVAGRVQLVRADFRKAAARFRGAADRVVMPLPEGGWRFLPEAIRCLRPGGMLHFYAIGRFADSEAKLLAAAKRAGRRARIVRRARVLPYAPRIWKICIDAVVL